MYITDQTFDTLCTLAGVRVVSEERGRIQDRVASVLNYVEQLQNLSMRETITLAHGRSLDVLRADVEQGSEPNIVQAITKQYIQSAGDQLIVPAVMGRDT